MERQPGDKVRYLVLFPTEGVEVEVEVPLGTDGKERYEAVYQAAVKLNLDRKFTMQSLWKNSTVRKVHPKQKSGLSRFRVEELVNG